MPPLVVGVITDHLPGANPYMLRTYGTLLKPTFATDLLLRWSNVQLDSCGVITNHRGAEGITTGMKSTRAHFEKR